MAVGFERRYFFLGFGQGDHKGGALFLDTLYGDSSLMAFNDFPGDSEFHPGSMIRAPAR